MKTIVHLYHENQRIHLILIQFQKHKAEKKTLDDRTNTRSIKLTSW
jgi:hypothetical protein